jgi:hypothetical protein
LYLQVIAIFALEARAGWVPGSHRWVCPCLLVTRALLAPQMEGASVVEGAFITVVAVEVVGAVATLAVQAELKMVALGAEVAHLPMEFCFKRASPALAAEAFKFHVSSTHESSAILRF